MSTTPFTYVILHNCGLNGAVIDPARAYPTRAAAQAALDELFKIPRHDIPGDVPDIRKTTGYGGTEIVQLILEEDA